ncbi:unnamed protein product [Musa textilis]
MIMFTMLKSIQELDGCKGCSERSSASAQYIQDSTMDECSSLMTKINILTNLRMLFQLVMEPSEHASGTSCGGIQTVRTDDNVSSFILSILRGLSFILESFLFPRR